MSTRTRYLVTYDICDPKRLRRVAKVLEGFGTRLQYSVFECPLDRLRFERMKSALHEELNHDQDQVLFVTLGPEESARGLGIEAMGLPCLVSTRVTIV